MRGREGEVDAVKEGKKVFLPLPLRIQEKKIANSTIKIASFVIINSG